MTSAEGYRPNVGVHLVLINTDGQVLLLQRANTGFAGIWTVREDLSL